MALTLPNHAGDCRRLPSRCRQSSGDRCEPDRQYVRLSRPLRHDGRIRTVRDNRCYIRLHAVGAFLAFNAYKQKQYPSGACCELHAQGVHGPGVPLPADHARQLLISRPTLKSTTSQIGRQHQAAGELRRARKVDRGDQRRAAAWRPWRNGSVPHSWRNEIGVRRRSKEAAEKPKQSTADDTKAKGTKKKKAATVTHQAPGFSSPLADDIVWDRFPFSHLWPFHAWTTHSKETQMNRTRRSACVLIVTDGGLR
jgi:hypothetical protein